MYHPKCTYTIKRASDETVLTATVSSREEEDRKMATATDIRRENLRLSNEESNRITCESIRMALIILLGQKTYDKITVTDIINKAGVSRCGFYRNYKSKEEVLNQIADEVGRTLFDEYLKAAKTGDFHACYVEIYSYIIEHKGFFNLMLKAEVPAEATFRLKEKLERLIKDEAAEQYYFNISLLASVVSCTVQWFRRGMKETPEQMATIMEGIINART